MYRSRNRGVRLPANFVPLCVPTVSKHPSNGWLEWRADHWKTKLVCALVLLACALFLLVCLTKVWPQYYAWTPSDPFPVGDFFALWSYAKIAASHAPTDLYDLAALHAAQVALGMAPTDQKPFPYPPTFIAWLWPMHFLPFKAAYFVSTLGSIVLFIGVFRAACSRSWFLLTGVIVAPATAAVFLAGQTGFLAAALALGGLSSAARRPVLGGVLLGLLSYKPQLGFLVPVALASAGLWRAFSIATAMVFIQAFVAGTVFGWAIWPAWLEMLPSYAGTFDQRMDLLKYKPTIMADLEMLGVSLSTARFAQVFAAVLVALLIAACFRKRRGPLPIAALLVGTFLASPHAFVYDLPMVLPALALFVESRLATTATFTPPEVAILALAFAFPAFTLIAGLALPFTVVPLLLLFGLVLRELAAQPGPTFASIRSQIDFSM